MGVCSPSCPVVLPELIDRHANGRHSILIPACGWAEMLSICTQYKVRPNHALQMWIQLDNPSAWCNHCKMIPAACTPCFDDYRHMSSYSKWSTFHMGTSVSRVHDNSWPVSLININIYGALCGQISSSTPELHPIYGSPSIYVNRLNFRSVHAFSASQI